MYCNKRLRQYLNDLAARLPAPGGGSAAALTAALGSSLISMVINFTLGKPKYVKHEKELKGVLEKSEQLRETFLNLVDLDVAAFKSKNIRDCLGVSLMLARLCFEGIKLCPLLIKKGNVNLASDVAVAAILLESAFASAYFNVEINLKFLKDEKLARGVRKELLSKGNKIKKIRQETEARIGKIIRLHA
jgi:methenyltetrahydrofolate cyclohydrolase